VSLFLINAVYLSIVILHFTYFIASSNTIVTLYKSSRLLIFLNALAGVLLLDLQLEEDAKEEKRKVELIGVYEGITIGS
jgi:hypothetical protein